MAEAEIGTPRAALFSGLTAEAENQVGIWVHCAAVPEHVPELRARAVAALVRSRGGGSDVRHRQAARGQPDVAQICMRA
jgi:hypothetical protein